MKKLEIHAHTTLRGCPAANLRRQTAGLLAVTLAGATALAVPFTPGNLAVLRVGDGLGALGSASTNIFIEEYTTAGAFVQTVAIPTSGTNALVNSGSATSEGALSFAPNGRWLCFAGYNTNSGIASIATSTAVTVPRALGIVDAAGTYTLAAKSTNWYSANNIRSAATDGTNSFWGCGTPSGVTYFGLAAPTSGVYTANLRVVQIVNGNLLFSAGSGTRGVYGFSSPGLPTAPATTNLLFGTGANSSPYAFAFSPAGNIAYVADDSSVAAGGGIQRWTNSGGTWTLVYTNITQGCRGLTVDWSGANPVIYATTTTNSIIAVTDTGALSTATVLVKGAANTAFRGLAFAPLAAPAITAPPVGVATNANSSFKLSVSATGYGTLSYQWRREGTNLIGQTAATLPFNSAQVSDSGNYDVVVANSVFVTTSAVAVVTITNNVITPPQMAQPVLLGDGNYQLNFTGTAGAGYSVWAATNLLLAPIPNTWSLLGGGVFSGNGAASFSDLTATNYLLRFYLISVP